MDQSAILKPLANTSQTTTSKARRLISCWLLAELVLVGSVLNFLGRLNEKGILGMGADFSPNQLFWGDGVWMNLFRLVIFVFFAGVFGFLYGYLSKKITTSEKIIVNTINSFLNVFGSIFILFLTALIFIPGGAGEINSSIGLIINTFVSSPFYLIFLALNLVGVFSFGFWCVDFGSKTINNPYHAMDKEKSATLLGIRWYHYLWLWVPIGFYGQVLLDLIYATGHALITFVRNVHWFDFFGAVVVSEDATTTANSLNVAWGKLIGIYIAAIIIFYLLAYLREILAGEKEVNLALKILISLGIGFVLPFILIWFTVLGA